MEKHTYTVNIQWTQDRKGVICSPELDQAQLTTDNCLEVATPPQFDKGVPGVWSPEHLFTASVSSCLMTTFLAIAEYSRLEFTEFRCESTGVLEKVEGKMQMSEIILKPVVTITDPSKYDKALRVVEKSEKACLISNSITSKISMEAEVEVLEVV